MFFYQKQSENHVLNRKFSLFFAEKVVLQLTKNYFFLYKAVKIFLFLKFCAPQVMAPRENAPLYPPLLRLLLSNTKFYTSRNKRKFFLRKFVTEKEEKGVLEISFFA
jgi:hypothetical protein